MVSFASKYSQARLVLIIFLWNKLYYEEW